jgi:hypothetical protein
VNTFCGQCGHPMDGEVCTRCGASVTDPVTVQVAPPGPVAAKPTTGGLGFLPMLGIAAAALVAVLVMAGVVIGGETGADDVATGIGSCWAATDSTDTFDPVACDDPAALYKITSHVDDSSQCTGSGYFEDGKGAYCTEDVTHG